MNIIKLERIKKGMKQPELAKMCNVKQSMISKIENEKQKPSPNLIIKLSNNLKICPATIFCYYYGDECIERVECNLYKKE